MLKNSISIGTKVNVRVRDKLGSFSSTSPVATGEVVFISQVANFVVVNLGNHCTSYWIEDIWPAE